MLLRQKLVIQTLRAAGRPLSRLELVKWLFVLRQQLSAVAGPTFYEFLPHHRGPYSFVLRRELDSLASDGIVVARGERWQLATGEVRSGVSADQAKRMEAVFRPLRGMTEEELLDHVYTNHPEFTMCGESRRLVERPTADCRVYTCGYEGVSVDGFLWLLIRSGIRRLIDVRRNPIARRYGFHKTTLAGLCGRVGVEYQHLPELGIASERRNGNGTPPERGVLLDWYESEYLPGAGKGVASVAGWVLDRPSAVMCQESDPCECHRSRLANRVAEVTGLPLVHLRHSS